MRTPWSSGAHEVASGAPLIVDVEIGPGPGLYALSQGVWTPELRRTRGGRPPEHRQPRPGRPSRHLHGSPERLDRPTSVAFTRDAAYVVTLTGKVLKIDDVASRTGTGGTDAGARGAGDPEPRRAGMSRRGLRSAATREGWRRPPSAGRGPPSRRLGRAARGREARDPSSSGRAPRRPGEPGRSPMLRKFKPRAPGLLIALVVLAVAATSGSAVAGSLITSKQIKDGTIKYKDVHKRARTKLKGATGPQGSQGPQGDQGAPGPATGPAGGALAGSYPNPQLADELNRLVPVAAFVFRGSDGELQGEAHRAPMAEAPAIARTGEGAYLVDLPGVDSSAPTTWPFARTSGEEESAITSQSGDDLRGQHRPRATARRTIDAGSAASCTTSRSRSERGPPSRRAPPRLARGRPAWFDRTVPPRHDATPAELKARLEADRDGLPYLAYRDGDGCEQLLALGDDRGPVTLGRSADAGVALTWDPRGVARPRERGAGGRRLVDPRRRARAQRHLRQRRADPRAAPAPRRRRRAGRRDAARVPRPAAPREPGLRCRRRRSPPRSASRTRSAASWSRSAARSESSGRSRRPRRTSRSRPS